LRWLKGHRITEKNEAIQNAEISKYQLRSPFNIPIRRIAPVNQCKKKQQSGYSPAESFVDAGADNTGPLFSLIRCTYQVAITKDTFGSDTWQEKCPPQEQAFLLTFLALKKVRRLAGRDPPVLRI
jgi:hypothetical protein